MVRAWQLWLSPRPVQRTPTPTESSMLSPEDAALYEFTYGDDGRFVVRETHFASVGAVQEERSGPPLHIHLRQTEYFKVIQGKLGIIKGRKTQVITKDDGVLEILPGTRHRFFASSPVEEDVAFEVWAMPQTPGMREFDEHYLRNILGYLRDCQEQRIPVSIFQLALFGWSSDTLFVCPSFYVPLWILKLSQFVIGNVIGSRCLGYRTTYPEYNTKLQR